MPREDAEAWMRAAAALPDGVYEFVERTPGCVLLESSCVDAENFRSYLFSEPVEILSAAAGDALPELFAQVEAALARGCTVAGYVSYEAGYALQGMADAVGAGPVAWFGVYREAAVFDHRDGTVSGAALPVLEGEAGVSAGRVAQESVTMEIGREAYGAKVEAIQRRIAEGATYQVNFTDRIRFAAEMSAAAMYRALRQRQPVAYGAMIHAGERMVLSFSPELFFRVEGERIVTRPMKGTWARGLDAEEDALAAMQLREDEKNRAEHLMIVDLLRNDLGRICERGSVRVEELFAVERYETLLQMTSTIAGVLPKKRDWHAVFRALFPSGSITGAPKISTMGILRELESAPRGVYTGAIGFLTPRGDAVFNVAIRTLEVEGGRVTMGVGGGIVSDSDAEAEFEECRLKASFLTRERPEFALLETMLWDGGFVLLEMHLERLRMSCEYFGFSFCAEEIEAQLDGVARTFLPLSRHRVRMTVQRDGRVGMTSSLLAEDGARGVKEGRVRLAEERTFSGDVFLRHKTTHRAVYDRAFEAAQREGIDEVLFLNERGEVTEGAISNVFARIDGVLVTPPVRCGVLPGVYRRHLMEAARRVEERVLTMEDVQAAEELYVCNSVRGLRRVTELLVTPVTSVRRGG